MSKNGRLCWQSISQEFHRERTLDTTTLAFSLMGLRQTNLALNILKRFKAIDKGEAPVITKKVERTTNYLQYYKGITALRNKSFTQHGFSNFIYKVQMRYKTRSELRTKFFTKTTSSVMLEHKKI